MQARATIIYNSANEPQYVVCMNYVIGENEGRRYLMLEQEENGVQEPDIRGAIDVTSLSSPAPTHSTISSGYCSAEEDHSYSTTRPREPLTPESGSVDFSLPNTPTAEGMALDMCTDTEMTNSLSSLGDKISEFRTDDINLEELIDDWLDADSSSPVTTTSTTTLTQATLANTSTHNSISQSSQWLSGFNPDFEMMDIDQASILGNGLASDSNESILMNLLKDSEKNDKGSPSMICENENLSNGCTALESGFDLTQSDPSGPNCSSSFLNTHKGHETKVSSSIQDPVLSAHFNTYNNCVPQSLSPKVSATATSYPSGMIGITSDADGGFTENAQDFSLGLANQQMGDVLVNYLEDTDPLPLTNFDTQTDDLNDNPFTSVLNDTDFRIEPLSSLMSSIHSSTYQSLSSSPSLSNGYFQQSPGGSRGGSIEKMESKHSSSNPYPGLDDHLYSSRQESPTTENKAKKGPRTVSNHRSEPSVLEKFLLTKQTLNPNKGSDAALAAQGISKLNIKDQQRANGGYGQADENIQEDQANLLKKLLTGEMDKREVTKHEQRVIANRRISVNSPPQPQTSLESYPSLDTDEIAYDTAQNIDLHLLGTETTDMEKLWSPSHDSELMGSGELDEILREQLRQEDLWLQHYINDIL